jgi:rhomboid protease GluP
MPEKKQMITAEGYDAARLLALAYGACEKLGWNIKYAGENILVAYTPRKAFRWDMEMTFQTADGQLTVTSKMIHDEAFDMMKRNQKNIDQFVAAFEEVKQKADGQSMQDWNEKISALMKDTIKVAEEEVKQIAEVDKVMNFSTGNMYLTYGIIAVNLIVFIVMVIGGAELFQPSGLKHIKWGTNDTPLTLSGDWWRLLSSNYIHFGLIHVALNMYALYNLGMFLEPMLGKARYFAAYTATGILASLTSLWWHTDGVNSAGASGAIFGLIGLMLAFIVTKYIPTVVRQGLLQSVGIMAVYSLFYGLKGGVDNAAHIGGLIAGFIVGIIYWYMMKQKNKAGIGAVTSAGILIFSIGVAGWYLDKNKVSAEERRKELTRVENWSSKDSEKYFDRYNQFVEWQDKALNIYKTTERIDAAAVLLAKANWDKAEDLLIEMKKLNVTDNLQQQTKLLTKYVELRKQELDVIRENPFNSNSQKKDSITNAINETMVEFNKLQSPN